MPGWARGFLGRHLVRRLLRVGAEVHAVSRAAGGSTAVTRQRVDLADAEATAGLVERVRPRVGERLLGWRTLSVLAGE